MKHDLLAIRRLLKRKKPEFLRQDWHKKPSLGRKWRRPKGITSKIRLSKRGYRKKVKKGYKSPKEVRGLNREGKKDVIIFNQKSVKDLDKTKQSIIIGSSVGNKKRIEIMQEALKYGISIMNQKNPEGYIRKVQEEFAKRKNAKIESAKDKGKRKKDPQKKSEEKKPKKEEEIQGDKKKKDKDEKDKVLTKRI